MMLLFVVHTLQFLIALMQDKYRIHTFFLCYFTLFSFFYFLSKLGFRFEIFMKIKNVHSYTYTYTHRKQIPFKLQTT